MYALKLTTKNGKTLKGTLKTSGGMDVAMRETGKLLDANKVKLEDVTSIGLKWIEGEDSLVEAKPRGSKK